MRFWAAGHHLSHRIDRDAGPLQRLAQLPRIVHRLLMTIEGDDVEVERPQIRRIVGTQSRQNQG